MDEEETKQISKDEENLIYKDSLNYYLNHSWNQCHDRILPLLLKFNKFEQKYFHLFINSGIKSKEIGASSIIFQLQNLQKYINSDTKNKLKFSISLTLFKSKEFAQSYLILKNILVDEINEPNAWYLLGKIYFEYQKIEESSQCFFNSIKLNRNNFRVYDKLGNIYFTKKLFNESLQFYLMSIYLLKKFFDENFVEYKILKLRIKIASVQCLLNKSTLKISLGM